MKAAPSSSTMYGMSVIVAQFSMSLCAIALYIAKAVVVQNMTKEVNETRGNEYIRLTYVALVNEYYTYVMSFTVFTSTLKFCKLLAFLRAFKQTAATIRISVDGLSTFFVEFMVVFMGFTCFFYFVLKNDMENFRDFIRSLENTMAMSIGKFNFQAIREADEMAAWIFFIFSVTVNMILINMMIAIINFALEEIKENQDKFESRFKLFAYIKRTCKEVVGVTVAKPVKIEYVDPNDDPDLTGSDEEEADRYVSYRIYII